MLSTVEQADRRIHGVVRVAGNGHPHPLSAVLFGSHTLANEPNQAPIGRVNASIVFALAE